MMTEEESTEIVKKKINYPRGSFAWAYGYNMSAIGHGSDKLSIKQ